MVGGWTFYSQKFKKPITKEEIKPEEKPTEKLQEIAKTEELECIIFDKEFCQKGESLYDRNGKFAGLGFNLPDKTKIYSPFDGTIETTGCYDIFEDQCHQGVFIQKIEGTKLITFAALGRIKPLEELKESDLLQKKSVKRGEVVAEVDDTLPYIIITPSEDPFKEKTYNAFVGFWELDNLKGEGGFSKKLYEEFFGKIDF